MSLLVRADIHLQMSCNRGEDLRIGLIASVASLAGTLAKDNRKRTTRNGSRYLFVTL